MSLSLDRVGVESRVHELDYDFKSTVLYALGIGAKAEELSYLYEKHGPKVYPTFAVVPAYPILSELVEKSGGNFAMVVHAGQSVRMHRPFPAGGRLSTQGKIAALYDLKRMSQMVMVTSTRLDGELICETEWSLLFRDEGGFGGPRPPKLQVPKVPKDRAPDFSFAERVSEEQALLYRLCGDYNPLHADPEFARSVGFERGPILHGLSTFGFVGRAVARAHLGGDADRIRFLSAQFKKPVWPGETLETRGHVEDGGLVLEAFAGGRPEPVVSQCWAEIG